MPLKYIIHILIALMLVIFSFPMNGADRQQPMDSSMKEQLAEAESAMDNGFYNEALTLLLDMVERMERPGCGVNDSLRSRAYMLVGNIYLAYNAFPEALDYYVKSLEYTGGSSRSSLMILQNTTVASCFTGNRELAEDANRRLAALNVPDSLRGKQLSDLCIGKAFIAKYFGSSGLSVTEFRRTLEIIDSAGLSDRERATPLSELYEYYDRAGMADSALYYLVRYDSLAREFRIPQMMADSKRGLMRTYIRLNDNEHALQAFDDYFAVIDSLYKPQMFISLNNQFHRNNMSRANEKIERLESTVYLQKTILLALIFVVVLSGILFFMRKRINSFRKELFIRNQEIVSLENKISQPSIDAGRQKEIMDKITTAVADPDILCNPDFSLEALAKMIGSNSKYVSTAINESTGGNFRTFINTRRIQEARKRLTKGYGYENLTIQAVGESVGFRSHANFINAFKKVTGLTPSVYMKMLREDCDKK